MSGEAEVVLKYQTKVQLLFKGVWLGIKNPTKKIRLKTSHMPIIKEEEIKKNIKGLNIFALRTDRLSDETVLGNFVINSFRLKSFSLTGIFSTSLFISDVCYVHKGNGLIFADFL